MIDHFRIKLECSVCDTNIWEYDGAKLKKSPEYHEIHVRLSDLSGMKVGVCSKHTKPRTLELKMITEKVHQGWLEEVALGIGNRDWVESKGLKLKAVG